MSPKETKRKQKVLVVDDLRMIHEIASQLLTAAGYEALRAMNGKEALAVARKERPDLIVLDLVLPQKTGTDIAREMRTDPRLEKTPILIISGIVPGESVSAALRNYGITEFISKDDLIPSLISRVQEILSKHTHRAA